MVLRNKRTFYLFFIAIVTFLTGCSGDEKSVSNSYYLSLMGESQTWNLTDYEVVITPDSLKAGNGTLVMKNKNEYLAELFHFETHVVINEKDTVVHTGAVGGEGIDIAKNFTGAIEGEEYLNEDGSPITLNDVSNIYMIVEWLDIGKGDNNNERIDLYEKDRKDNTFLK